MWCCLISARSIFRPLFKRVKNEIHKKPEMAEIWRHYSICILHRGFYLERGQADHLQSIEHVRELHPLWFRSSFEFPPKYSLEIPAHFPCDQWHKDVSIENKHDLLECFSIFRFPNNRLHKDLKKQLKGIIIFSQLSFSSL